jgi:hypothetical protein
MFINFIVSHRTQATGILKINMVSAAYHYVVLLHSSDKLFDYKHKHS